MSLRRQTFNCATCLLAAWGGLDWLDQPLISNTDRTSVTQRPSLVVCWTDSCSLKRDFEPLWRWNPMTEKRLYEATVSKSFVCVMVQMYCISCEPWPQVGLCPRCVRLQDTPYSNFMANNHVNPRSSWHIISLDITGGGCHSHFLPPR